MSKALSFPLLTVAGFIIGVFSGHHLPATSLFSTGKTLVRSASGLPGHTATRTQIAAVPEEKHDLTSLLRWQLQQKDGDPMIRNEIGRMDSLAIRDLMTRLYATYGIIPDEVLTAAAKELYLREGEKALAWADSLSWSARNAILEQVIAAAVEVSPESARSWIASYQAEFGSDITNPFPHAALTGATLRGAADVLELKKLYGDEMTFDGLPAMHLPDDFDFHLLISQSTDLASMGQTMEYWTVRDREGAWAGVREIMNGDAAKGANFFGSIFTGIAVTEGEQKAARWISGKLDELTPDLGERAISTLLTNQLTQNVAHETLLAEFPHDADRVALAASVVNPFGNPVAGYNVLQALGSESLRTDALVRSAKTFSRVASDPADPSSESIHSYFAKTMDQLNLTPGLREKVEAILNTPQDPYPR